MQKTVAHQRLGIKKKKKNSQTLIKQIKVLKGQEGEKKNYFLLPSIDLFRMVIRTCSPF